MSKTSRRQPPIDGILLADAYYAREGLSRALGIGDDKLLEAQTSGQLPYVRFGTRNLYWGRDVIQWINVTGTKTNVAEHGRGG